MDPRDKPEDDKLRAKMSWTYLLLAGLMEILATTLYRYIDGFTRPIPTAAFVVCVALSFYFLQRSLAGVPLGTAYAVWTGIGAAGTAILGILAYGEPAGAARIALLAILVGSIVGLNLTG
jgi:quaternary ammonium compound-resistance protein SugE